MNSNHPNGSYINSCPWHSPGYNSQCPRCVNAAASIQAQRNLFNAQSSAYSTATLPPAPIPPPPHPQVSSSMNPASFLPPVSAFSRNPNPMQANHSHSSGYPPVFPNLPVPQARNTGNQQYPIRPVGSPGVTQTTLNHRKKVPAYFCPVPGCESQGFTEKHNYIYHMRSHEGIKPFECTRCGRPFRSQSDLTRHLNKSKKRCDHRPY